MPHPDAWAPSAPIGQAPGISALSDTGRPGSTTWGSESALGAGTYRTTWALITLDIVTSKAQRRHRISQKRRKARQEERARQALVGPNDAQPRGMVHIMAIAQNLFDVTLDVVGTILGEHIV